MTLVQRLQASLRLAQFLGQGRQREVRVGGGPGGHDAQRQRQPGAPGDDLLYRLRLGRYPVFA